MIYPLYTYKGITYPNYLKTGNASSYILPIAQNFCNGNGLDVGGTDESHFPGARIVNVARNDDFDALHLPPGSYDYIFSSHTLEHVIDWKGALSVWRVHLKSLGGVMFLYLPHPDMLYWLPGNCPRHLHLFTPAIIYSQLISLGFSYIFHSERDLFWSFSVVGIL